MASLAAVASSLLNIIDALLSATVGSLVLQSALGAERSLARTVHAFAIPLEAVFSQSAPFTPGLIGALRCASSAHHVTLQKAVAAFAASLDNTPYVALRVGGAVVAATDGWRSIHPHESLALSALLESEAGGRAAADVLSSESPIYLPRTHTHAPHSPWRLMAFSLVAGVQLVVLAGAKFRTREVEDVLLVPAFVPHLPLLRETAAAARRGLPPTVVLDRGVLAYILLDTTNVAFYASFDLSPVAAAAATNVGAAQAPASLAARPGLPPVRGGYSPGMAQPLAGRPAVPAPAAPPLFATSPAIRQAQLCAFYASVTPLLKPTPQLAGAQATSLVSVADDAVFVAVVRDNIRFFVGLDPAVPGFAHLPLAAETLDKLLPHAHFLAK